MNDSIISSSLSLRCEAGSTSSYGVRSRGHSLGKPKALVQCSTNNADLLESSGSSSLSYQVTRFIDEPSLESGVRLFFRVESSRSNFEKQARGIDPIEPLPVKRTGTYSSVASDESHCSVPQTRKLVKNPETTHTDFSDEEEFESESDEDEDAFKALNTAIIQVLGADRAIELIPHLYQLPAPLRAIVFGFGIHSSNVEEDGDSLFENGSTNVNPIQGSMASRTSKRKRTESESGNRTSHADTTSKRKPRAKAYSKIQKLKYACPFNIFNPKRYCIHNEIESTGGRYTPCMGPGFIPVRHLKEHFESCHRMPQCQRCWKIFDNLEALSYHTDKEEPRCENQTHLLVEKKETITEIEWSKILASLSQPRGGERKSEPEKWFEVWDILFPKSIYKGLARPAYPYYVDPQGGDPQIPTYPETERVIEIWKTLWDEEVKRVQAENPDAEYHPSKEEVEKLIREAISLTKESPSRPLSSDYVANTTAIESAVQSQLPGYSENTQPGYHQTPPESFADSSPLQLDHPWSSLAPYNFDHDWDTNLRDFGS